MAAGGSVMGSVRNRGARRLVSGVAPRLNHPRIFVDAGGRVLTFVLTLTLFGGVSRSNGSTGNRTQIWFDDDREVFVHQAEETPKWKESTLVKEIRSALAEMTGKRGEPTTAKDVPATRRDVKKTRRK